MNSKVFIQTRTSYRIENNRLARFHTDKYSCGDRSGFGFDMGTPGALGIKGLLTLSQLLKWQTRKSLEAVVVLKGVSMYLDSRCDVPDISFINQ